MAFDLCLDNGRDPEQRAWIAPHEEAILSSDAQRYPQLCRLAREFYAQPSISPGQSQALVQEIIGRMLEEPQGADSPLAEVALRLLVLFDQAYRQRSTIRCVGD